MINVGDHVACAGEASDVFEVVEIDVGARAALLRVEGRPDKWEQIDKLTTQQPCENCGAVDATFGADPYAYDVHSDDTPHWLCEQCRYESGRDI